MLLEIIDTYAKQGPAMIKQNWDREWDQAQLDWQLSEKAARPDIVRLFKLYAQKTKRP